MITPNKHDIDDFKSPSPSAGVDLNNKKERKIHWSEENETILVEWCDIAQCYKWLYTRSHSQYSSMHAWFTIPTIILSTISGTASFAQASLPTEYQSYATLGIGTLNILIGICATVQQYLKISELNESHRVSSISWDKFARNIRIELAKSPDERTDAGSFIKMCRQEFDRLMETSPRIPDKTVAEFVRKFRGNTEEEKHKFKELKKPDICDTITTVNETRHKWYLAERKNQQETENEYMERKYSFESVIDNENTKNNFSNVILSRLKDIHRKKSEGMDIENILNTQENILKTQEEIDKENLSEGFTGTQHPPGASCVLRTLTRGAVKPRSSVDVDELRQRIPEGNSRLAPSERDPIGVSTLVVPDSSKSMDDEKKNIETKKIQNEKDKHLSFIQQFIQSFYGIYDRYPMNDEIKDGVNSETDKNILDEFLKNYDPNTYNV